MVCTQSNVNSVQSIRGTSVEICGQCYEEGFTW